MEDIKDMNGNLVEDCIFCKIIRKEIPANIVYENDFVIAFKDIKPVSKIHIVVIPKKHIESLEKLDIVNDAKYVVEIHKAVQEITRSLKVEKSGYRVVTNISKDAGQEVRHIHYHILAGEKLRKYEIIKFANKKGINMDELFGTDSLSKKKKKIIDKEKEEKKRTIIVFVCLIIIASIVSYVYILFNSSSKIDNAKGILRRGFV